MCVLARLTFAFVIKGSAPSSLMSGSATFRATLAPSFFTSWIGRFPRKPCAPSLRSFTVRTTCVTGTFHFRNRSFLFFNTVAVFCRPATQDTMPTSPRTAIISWSSTGTMEPLRNDTTGFWVSAALLAQLLPDGLNASRMLANFFCRSIRSAKIRAWTVSSFPDELTVIQEVALTVTGTPLTVLVIATGPTAVWAVALEMVHTASNAPRPSALMPNPYLTCRLKKRRRLSPARPDDTAHWNRLPVKTASIPQKAGIRRGGDRPRQGHTRRDGTRH